MIQQNPDIEMIVSGQVLNFGIEWIKSALKVIHVTTEWIMK